MIIWKLQGNGPRTIITEETEDQNVISGNLERANQHSCTSVAAGSACQINAALSNTAGLNLFISEPTQFL